MCWQNSLRQRLTKFPQPDSRLAIIGVGQELRGDDGAGVSVARQLLEAAPAPCFLVVDAGPAPENYTGLLRRFAPDVVVVVDAAAIQRPPGSIQLLTGDDISGLSASTHSLPLNLLAHYLALELHCEVLFLAIQPQDTTLGANLSSPVQRAVNEVVLTLQTMGMGNL